MKDTDCFTHVLSLALQTSHWQSTVYHHINLHCSQDANVSKSYQI